MEKLGRNSILVVVAIAVLASVLAACGPQVAADDLPLQGTQWTLVSIGAEAVPADVNITALFEGDRVGGSAGCNNYFAGFETDGKTLAFTPVGATRMMCPGPVMGQEKAFLSALEMVDSFEISGDRLEMGSLVFAAN